MRLYKTVILFLLAWWMAQDAFAQKAKHVVLITIDGFRPDFYRDIKWGAVNLQQMAQQGVSANGVNPIFPSLTFPNHTTIMTGVLSATHGIYHNAPFARDGKSTEWYWYEKDIQTATLWDAVKATGGVAVSVNWPVSAGAPVDYNIPIIKRKGYTQLAITSQYAQPPGLMEEVQQYATGILDSISFNTNEDLYIIDENVARITAYLIRKHKPVLTTIRLSCVDHFEHLEGREGHRVKAAVAGADRAIRTILESLQRAGMADSTAVIVTGDHGFVNVHHSFSPNVLLKEVGLQNNVTKGHWKAQFKPAGGSAFLYLKDMDDQQTLKKVLDLLNKLPELKAGKFRIINRQVLDSMGCDPAAALALTAASGYSFVGTDKGTFIKPVKRGTHGYFPDFKEIQTGFVGFGAGFRQGVIIPEMALTDIAPLVARLLALPWKDGDAVTNTNTFIKD